MAKLDRLALMSVNGEIDFEASICTSVTGVTNPRARGIRCHPIVRSPKNSGRTRVMLS